MDNHLHRLAIQRKLSSSCLLQGIATRPFGMSHSGLLMHLATQVPYTCRFHLSRFQASKQLWGGLQSIHAYCIHCCLLGFLLLLDVFLYGRQNLSIERPIVLFCYLSYLFQQMGRESDSERFAIFFHATILALLRLHIKRYSHFHLDPLKRMELPRPSVKIQMRLFAESSSRQQTNPGTKTSNSQAR